MVLLSIGSVLKWVWGVLKWFCSRSGAFPNGFAFVPERPQVVLLPFRSVPQVGIAFVLERPQVVLLSCRSVLKWFCSRAGAFSSGFAVVLECSQVSVWFPHGDGMVSVWCFRKAMARCRCGFSPGDGMVLDGWPWAARGDGGTHRRCSREPQWRFPRAEELPLFSYTPPPLGKAR